MNLFENLGLSNNLLESIHNLGITTPTMIQDRSIPHIIAGKDVIGESATGSGKTIAFGCGIIEKVTPSAGLQALVLAPTRELAEQVRRALAELSGQKHMRIISIYGGVSIEPQIENLRRADVVVATPGRMLDHMQRGTVNLSRVKVLVLDEADRMLDMGFIDDVEQIIRQCPKDRQTMFFSATISYDIKRLADRYMKHPEDVAATKMVDPTKLKQAYYDVPKGIKLSLLAYLLEKEKSGLAMVFCNSRDTTDFVVNTLRANRVSAIAIHGGMSQNKRNKTIEMFNRSNAGVLVCTDVAARGLHIENVSHVFNYDIPKDAKDYVHRIGRTARAGEEGKVVNLLSQNDYDNFSRVLSEYPDFNIESLEKPYLQNVIQVGRPQRSFGRRDFGRRGPPRREWRRDSGRR